MNEKYKVKYLKYKNKYIILKNQIAGMDELPNLHHNDCSICGELINENDSIRRCFTNDHMFHTACINIIFDNLINPVFLKYIQEKTKEYFVNKEKEYGGIITFLPNNEYEIVESEINDSNGMIKYPLGMLNNIEENQIIWHTHNLEREFKCEPPSGADLLISIDLAVLEKFPYSIAIHNNGIWIYKINSLNEKIKKDIDGYKEFVNWWISALNDLYCSPNFDETIKKYEIKDFISNNINYKMENLEQYYFNIYQIFKDNIIIEYIDF